MRGCGCAHDPGNVGGSARKRAARQGSLKDLLGVLKTSKPSPSDEECRAILEEELIKKHVR